MVPFLAAQADDPFDPAPMLILADWLEEHGDAIAAVALRALAESGTASLHALALNTAGISVPWRSDQFKHGHGAGDVLEDDRELGFGGGFGDGVNGGNGEGEGDGYGYEKSGEGPGAEDRYGDGTRFGMDDHYGRGDGDGDGSEDPDGYEDGEEDGCSWMDVSGSDDGDDDSEWIASSQPNP